MPLIGAACKIQGCKLPDAFFFRCFVAAAGKMSSTSQVASRMIDTVSAGDKRANVLRRNIKIVIHSDVAIFHRLQQRLLRNCCSQSPADV
jgi:hypothetical protein